MTIIYFRCTVCGHIQENPIDLSVECDKCGHFCWVLDHIEYDKKTN